MNDPQSIPEAEGSAADLRLPDELVAALRREETRWKLEVPVERDGQVRATCRAELSQRLVAAGNRGSATGARVIPFPRLWMRWAAAAVVVLLGGLVITRQLTDDPEPLEISVAQPTILDAFNLARRLKSPLPGGITHGDLNGDGRMDQRDVDWLAQRAVQLPEGGAL